MILLDTHAWIWHLADRQRLSEAARSAIDAESRDGTVLLSSISVWELFMLVDRGRLELSVQPAAFVTATHRDPVISIHAVDESVARRSVELPKHHQDPADRFILATAVELGVPIVSRDERFRSYAEVQTIW